LQHVQRQTVRFLKQLLKRVFGKEQPTFIFDLGQEDQQTLFCQDTCRGVCDDFDKGVSASSDGSTEKCSAGTAAPSAADIAAAANKTAAVLRSALERAGRHIRGATPALLLDEPTTIFGDLLSSGEGAWPSLADFHFGGGEQMQLDKKLDKKLLPLSGNGLSTEVPMGERLGRDMQAFPQNGHTLEVASNGHGELSPLAGSAGTSLELWPISQTNLLKSLPSAARWVEGSPPFFSRLLSRASSRLGGTVLLNSAKMLMR